MKFRNKTVVVIEARQVPAWPGQGDAVEFVNNAIGLAEWCGGISYLMDPPSHFIEGIHVPVPGGGAMVAAPGDWIIKGAHGEFYPCKPDLFEATYEPAED